MKKANPENVLTKHLARRVVARGGRETWALTDVRANDVDSVRIALEAAGYVVRPFQHKFHGHYVAMVEVVGDPKGIAKVMFPWIRKGQVRKVKGRVEDHFKVAGRNAPADLFNALLDAEKALMKLFDVQPSSKKDSATLSRSIAKVQKALQAIDREMSTIDVIIGKVNG